VSHTFNSNSNSHNNNKNNNEQTTRTNSNSTKGVQDTLVSKDTVIKKDKSPVTVADLSAQALISLHLLAHHPNDLIIGEEDTSELRANQPLREKVVGLVNDGFARVDGWGKGKTFSEDEILNAVDAGNASGGAEGRFWTIVSCRVE
jgi:3'(2'), 5'-bisphosphate nucleotidase